MPPMEFGSYMRHLRQEQSLSLREFVGMAGVSNFYLALVERGKRKPPGAEILKRLSPICNVPVMDLLKAADC